VVDLVSQGVLATAEYYIQKHSPDYPVGRSRLEALSVLACAGIMSMASIEVIQFSITDLVMGFMGEIPELEVGIDLYVILGVGVFLKLCLFLYCRFVNARIRSDTLEALAEDHLNDVLSNTTAIITAAVAFNSTAWYIDPFGAILISLVIIGRWFGVMSEQVRKVVGHTAPPDFIELVESLAVAHDTRLAVDCTRAYHFGSRYNVEMEIILPGNMMVSESHDIALALQHKIERLDEVERAFVHVDHLERDGLKHKVERELVMLSNENSPRAISSHLIDDASDIVIDLNLRSDKRQTSQQV
jgi:cation diffusion facilitator family transporter